MATSTAYFIDLPVISRCTLDAGTDGTTIRFGSHQFQFDPIIAIGGALQEAGNIVNGVDQDVHGPIIVKVTEGAPTAYQLRVKNRSRHA